MTRTTAGRRLRVREGNRKLRTGFANVRRGCRLIGTGFAKRLLFARRRWSGTGGRIVANATIRIWRWMGSVRFRLFALGGRFGTTGRTLAGVRRGCRLIGTAFAKRLLFARRRWITTAGRMNANAMIRIWRWMGNVRFRLYARGGRFGMTGRTLAGVRRGCRLIGTGFAKRLLFARRRWSGTGGRTVANATIRIWRWAGDVRFRLFALGGKSGTTGRTLAVVRRGCRLIGTGFAKRLLFARLRWSGTGGRTVANATIRIWRWTGNVKFRLFARGGRFGTMQRTLAGVRRSRRLIGAGFAKRLLFARLRWITTGGRMNANAMIRIWRWTGDVRFRLFARGERFGTTGRTLAGVRRGCRLIGTGFAKRLLFARRCWITTAGRMNANATIRIWRWMGSVRFRLFARGGRFGTTGRTLAGVRRGCRLIGTGFAKRLLFARGGRFGTTRRTLAGVRRSRRLIGTAFAKRSPPATGER